MTKEEIKEFAENVKNTTDQLSPLEMIDVCSTLFDGRNAPTPVYFLAKVASEMNADKCVIRIAENGSISLEFSAKNKKVYSHGRN